MANYIEYIKVGSGETWPIRDPEALHKEDDPSSLGLAPGGYGLGEAEFISMSDIDNITRPGWYYSNEDATIVGFSNSRWWMHVKAYGTGATFATQELYSFTSNIGVKFERHKINAAWGQWKDVSSHAFAPSGFGLGGPCETIDNWDNATKNGCYASNGNSPDNYWWWGEVFAFGTVVIQHLVRNNDVDNSPMSVYRTIFNSNPTPWEWVNPPMVVDVPYRTTERHNRNPVYKKIDSGGVAWWSINQNTWYREAERHGAEPAKVMVWENPSLSSGFPAQTIPLNLSGYSSVYVEAIRSNDSRVISGRVVVPVGGISGYLMGTTDQFAMTRREVTATTAGVTFSGFYSANSSNSDSNEIPYRIYGIKGVG